MPYQLKGAGLMIYVSGTVGACVCILQTVQGRKKAGVLKCHITRHGIYTHDMRCVRPHHRRPLRMCSTGPQPYTCVEDMHEIYTGMRKYQSPRVGNATLITFFFFFVFMLSAIILWLCLLLCLVVVLALSPHRQL